MSRVPLVPQVWCMTATISSIQCQSVLSHEASTSLVKVDIGQSRHCEICIRVQIDHNAYDYSQHVTLAHDASQCFFLFSDGVLDGCSARVSTAAAPTLPLYSFIGTTS